MSDTSVGSLAFLFIPFSGDFMSGLFKHNRGKRQKYEGCMSLVGINLQMWCCSWRPTVIGMATHGCSECVILQPEEEVGAAEADVPSTTSFRVSDVGTSGDEEDDIGLLRRPLR